MNPPTEFRRHAEECRRMARSTVNTEDRVLWDRMAERWLGCADRAQHDQEAAQALTRNGRHRKSAHKPNGSNGS